MRSGFRNFRDFRKLYLGVQIFPYYFGDNGLQRYPLSTKDFCNFFIGLSIWNRPFFCWFIFPCLGIWTGRVQTETKKKHYKILGTDTNTLFGGGLLLRTEILAFFNTGGFSITMLTLKYQSTRISMDLSLVNSCEVSNLRRTHRFWTAFIYRCCPGWGRTFLPGSKKHFVADSVWGVTAVSKWLGLQVPSLQLGPHQSSSPPEFLDTLQARKWRYTKPLPFKSWDKKKSG